MLNVWVSEPLDRWPSAANNPPFALPVEKNISSVTCFGVADDIKSHTIHSWPYFRETEWQFTWAQLCIAIRYKPFGLIQVSKDFRSGHIAHMKGNFVRGAPWIMQWQSGFAGLAEINMIPNKETRWNRRVLSSREGGGRKFGFREEVLRQWCTKDIRCGMQMLKKHSIFILSNA